MGRFEGWKGDFQGFFLGLKLDNSKAYFDAHRRTYEGEVKAPLVALLADLEPEFGPARVSRPNRDIRFSPDKSPYKTNIYASAHAGGYLALDAGGLLAAGGRYLMDTAELARFRAGAAAADSGAELAAIVAALREQGYDVGEPEMKRVPSPYPRDHPRADLLRRRRLVYWRRWDVGSWIATAEAGERVAIVWRDGAGLNAWMAAHVDP